MKKVFLLIAFLLLIPLQIHNVFATSSSYDISFLQLEKVLNKALKLSSIEKLADKFLTQLQPKNYQYFISFDSELRTEYDRYAGSFFSVFVNLEKYMKSKDLHWKQNIVTDLPILIEGMNANKDLELRYVDKNIVSGNIIYTPKNQVINKATGNLQDKILKKLNNLILTETISLDEYSSAMNAYNYFILHLDIFIEFKSQDAKNKALEQLKIFIPTYNKKVIFSMSK